MVLLQQTGFPQGEQSDTSDSSEGPANFKEEFQQLRSLKSHILKIGVTNIWVTNFLCKSYHGNETERLNKRLNLSGNDQP